MCRWKIVLLWQSAQLVATFFSALVVPTWNIKRPRPVGLARPAILPTLRK